MTEGRAGSPDAAAAVQPAATVLLLREDGGRLEVLLSKRAAGLSFMAGLWVFPGGRLEPEDRSPSLVAHVSPARFEPTRLRMLDRAGAPISAGEALGLHVAACRETFEESGVLLARDRPDAPSRDVQDLARRVAAARSGDWGAGRLAGLLDAEDLQLEVERLVYWSHWITPGIEKKRFDTRFFAVQVPASQVASIDRSELTQHAWVGEREVAARMASGEMRVAPPTVTTLLDLWNSHRRHGGVGAMLAGERRREVPPILPKVARAGDGEVEVVLPWDAAYAELPGEGCETAGPCPPHLQELPSRTRFRP